MFFGCCILRSGKEREEVEEKLKRITGKLIREHSLEGETLEDTMLRMEGGAVHA